MKKVLFILILGTAHCAFAQQYQTRKGNIQFEASVVGFEEIKAQTNTSSAIIDFKTGNVASIVFINAFQFKVGLMQEHFNENYLESEIYPKATFSGKLKELNPIEIYDETTKATLVGSLTIHGVSKSIEINCLIKKQNEEVTLKGEFQVSPLDFNIHIPSIVANKIAKYVNVKINYVLKP